MSSASDHRRTYSVTVDETDAVTFGVSLDGLTGRQKHKRLGALADLLVVEYMAREGALSTEFAKARMQELAKELTE